jgi:NADPH:quinone reductase-like Zn-dependent oxidoreductase
MSINGRKKLHSTEFGPPPVLRSEEVTIPEPAEAEALVSVKSPSINPGDISNVARHVKSTTLPRTPAEFALALGAKCIKE